MITREVTFGITLGVMIGLAAVVLLGRNESVHAQAPRALAGGTDSTVVVNLPDASGGQFVVLVDTAKQVIGSYHVDAESGKITLRSIRNYRWDFQMEEFNGAEPRPHEVRAIVEKR